MVEAWTSYLEGFQGRHGENPELLREIVQIINKSLVVIIQTRFLFGVGDNSSFQPLALSITELCNLFTLLVFLKLMRIAELSNGEEKEYRCRPILSHQIENVNTTIYVIQYTVVSTHI